MPELPEVETVRRGLAPVLEGRRLARVEARRPDLRFPFPEGFVQRLAGARVVALRRRAKYLLADLDRGETLVAHLGMSGRFRIEGAATPGRFHHAAGEDPRHDHVVLETETGERIVYHDPRRFGFMGLMSTEDLDQHPWFAAMGPEPLSGAFGGARLAEAFRDRRQGPKTLLLDQRTVAGLGNIYVCEALHEARISPFRPAGRISAGRLEGLARTVKAVLERAIAAGGSTLRDFSAADGALGYFQHSFRAYDRAGAACVNPGCGGTIRRRLQAGRSTFWCPTCQR
ncbi:bifunctional DNA-formamidopyrimidine glycosylase/DNA-(apurinic or apyrimidinic site) lyase [Phenylobacterium parvum]|uniref:Formamidopyrimidine-DNA glycosylase n=1 Tax=Phenylobacterium parvum TaxID=2201350 RepID=A0A2Z3HTR4_9CAUL|nr:bifunctional DNA-formamidopyrimidine glycosylase/DNA-(apurinic or apyrimidinic site) lyase [Phenylobacterium parvum]AWM78652.1 DNA-formamidopyrimidine glycosylase [Phenylobacterium parvum]